MTDDDRQRRVLHGEVIPATPRSVSLAPEVSHLPAGMLGVGLFARARYASERKQFEAYTRLVGAKNELLRALGEQQSLIVQYAQNAERARNLDDLREIARLQVKNELASLRGQAELSQLRFENERERLLYENEQLRRARTALNTPPPAPTSKEKKTLAESFDAVGKEIEEVEASFENLRADLIRRAGGEEKLSEEQRDRLKKFELLRDKLLNDAMEALF